MERYLNLNMRHGDTVPQRVKVSQYDKGWPIYVNMFYDNAAWTPPSGSTIYVQGTKKDLTGFSYAVSWSSNRATVPLTAQMTAFEGDVAIELVVMQNSSVRIGTANFILEVEPAALSDDIIVSETDLPLIQQLPEIIEQTEENAAKAVDAATRAETAKTGAEAARDQTIAAASQAMIDISDAKNDAITNIGTAKDGALSDISDAKDDAIADITPLVTRAEAAADNAETSETNALNSATAAATSATDAAQSADDASYAATQSALQATLAGQKAAEASQSASDAYDSAQAADDYAQEAHDWAEGPSGTSSQPADNNNAYYWAQQARDIAAGLSGALMPMGTITFAQLPRLADANAGWLYNISDKFTTTSDFKEGVGHVVAAGAEVYKTSDGYWSVMAGKAVTGVKGREENEYRTGDVSLSPANIGAVDASMPGTAGQAIGWDENGVLGPINVAADIAVDDETILQNDTTGEIYVNRFVGTRAEYEAAKTAEQIADGCEVFLTDEGSSGGSGGGHVILDSNGTALTQRDNLQFNNCRVQDDAVTGKTIVTPRAGYITYPTMNIDSNGHLQATGGSGIEFSVDSRGHLIDDVA